MEKGITNTEEILIMSCHHNYRLAYSVWLISQLLDRVAHADKPTEVYIMYDIACSLHRHLEV